jgi:hypothetical protein
MFYFAPEAGTTEKLVPEIMTHWPVSGTSQPAPETGTRNWLVGHRLNQDKPDPYGSIGLNLAPPI